MFAYCGNNPINMIDPSGYEWNSFHRLVDAIMFEGFCGLGNRYSPGVSAEVVTDIVLAGATIAVAYHFPIVIPMMVAYDYSSRYFANRRAGLGVSESILSSGVSTAIANIPLDSHNPAQQIAYDFILSEAADFIQEQWIDSEANSNPNTANSNAYMFNSRLNAAICVGGTMKYSTIRDWETGGALFGRL